MEFTKEKIHKMRAKGTCAATGLEFDLANTLNEALDEIERLQKENERLKDLICSAAPLAWVNRSDDQLLTMADDAHRWEIEASKLLRMEPK
jgi:hypothetical protein